jgi:hypothetical protein
VTRARHELYDLATDPDEPVNVHAERSAEVEDTRLLVDSYRADDARRRAHLGQGSRGSVGTDAGLAPPAPLDEERRRKLEALGYLDGPD